ncbi:MAG: glycosyltransferase [Pseudomonadota bacterium]
MPNRPKITILTPTYNRPAFLSEAIAGVLGQTRPDWELLVINDGGVEVGDIVAGFGDPRIIYHSRPRNMGKAACCNHGLARARGDFIAYLDDDDVWRPSHLEILSRTLEDNPDAVGAFSDLYLVPFILDPASGRRIPVEKILTLSRDFNRELMFHTNHVHHVSLLHRKEAAFRAGLYNESVAVLIDWNLNRKLAFFGDLVHVPVPTGEYHVSLAGSGRISSIQRQDSEKHRDSVRLIKADLPPEPWPFALRLAVVLPAPALSEATVAMVELILDHLDYPARIVVVDHSPRPAVPGASPVPARLDRYRNVSVITPPRPRSLFETYRQAAEVSGADYLFLADAGYQPGAVTKRFFSGLEYLQATPARGVRWDVPGEQASAFNCLVKKGLFGLAAPAELLGDRRAVPTLPRVGRPPRHLEFDVALARTRRLLDQGDVKGARAAFQGLLEIKSGGGRLPALMDLCLELRLQTGETERLEADIRAAIDRGYRPDNLVRLGRVLAARGRWEEAGEAFRAGLEAAGFREDYLQSEVFPYPFEYEPLVLTGLLGLGDSGLHLGDLARAEHFFALAAGFSSTSAKACLGLGRTFLAGGRKDQAFVRLGQALEKDAVNGPGLDLFLRTGRELGRWEEMRRVLQNLLARGPGRSAVRSALAEVEARVPGPEFPGG